MRKRKEGMNFNWLAVNINLTYENETDSILNINSQLLQL